MVKIRVYPKLYTLLALILLSELSPVFATATWYLMDGFEDGNINANPTWVVPTGSFSASSSYPYTGTYGLKPVNFATPNIAYFNVPEAVALNVDAWKVHAKALTSDQQSYTLRIYNGTKMRGLTWTSQGIFIDEAILVNNSVMPTNTWYTFEIKYSQLLTNYTIYNAEETAIIYNYLNYTDGSGLYTNVSVRQWTNHQYVWDDFKYLNDTNDGDYQGNLIFDNSTTHLKEYNNNISLNFTAYNNTGFPVPQTLTLNITGTDYNYAQNFTAWSTVSANLSSLTGYNYTALVYNPYNTSSNTTTYLYSTVYSLNNPSYNLTIPNGTSNTISSYLTKRLSGSSQNASVSIEIDGTNTTISNSSNWYNTTITPLTDLVIENFPFKIWLNNSYGADSVLSYTSGNFTVSVLEFDNCSTFTHQIINLTIKNERDRITYVPNSSLITSINFNGSYYLISTINKTNGVFGICLNNSHNFTADVNFNFYASGWGATDKKEREHFFFNIPINTTIIQQGTYKLQEAYASKIIFEVVNNVQQPLKNHYLILKRWYGDGYETVAMAKTDVNGQAVTYVELNDPYYALDILDENGNLIYETDRIILTSTPMSIIVGSGAIENYIGRSDDFTYSNTWDNSTEYFTTTINNINSVDSEFSLEVNSMNGTLLCYLESGETTSWTTSCLVDNWMNHTFFVKAIGTNSQGDVLIYNYVIDDTLGIDNHSTPEQDILGLFIIMLIISMGTLGLAPTLLPLSPAIALIISNALMITSFPIIIIGGVAFSGIVFLFWFLRS